MATLRESFGRLFTGFTVNTKKDKKEEKINQQENIISVDNTDAAYLIGGFGRNVGVQENLERTINEQRDRILNYRAAVTYPEVDFAIDEICNDAIVPSDLGDSSIELMMDEVETISDQIKDKIQDEFDYIKVLLNFEENGYSKFRNWYVDGVMYHHLIIDSKRPKEGIHRIVPLESTCTKLVKELKTRKDPNTGIETIEGEESFYIYDPILAMTDKNTKAMAYNNKVKLTFDSVVFTHSGIRSADGLNIVSYLDKAIKPLNNLKAVEDALVMYRLTRASEKRAFYIDVGSLPKKSAEEYVRAIMNQYKTNMVYDSTSGKVLTNGNQISMTEDYWLPRREGGLGTQIDTISGGQNLGNVDDISYFQKKLYKSLNIPVSRFEQENSMLGARIAEITRDEWKFGKFINRLRRQFAHLFLDTLKQQLILKQIITESDWEEISSNIRFDFGADSYIKQAQALDTLQGKFAALEQANNFVGKYYTREWVMQKILFMDEDEIKTMLDGIAAEKKAHPDIFPPPEDQGF
jgi:hypothetical protein